jgi:hypothetical protein
MLISTSKNNEVKVRTTSKTGVAAVDRCFVALYPRSPEKGVKTRGQDSVTQVVDSSLTL